jgi:hypothetical protein
MRLRLLRVQFALDQHLACDLDHDSHDAGRPSVVAQNRGVVEVEPDLFRLAAMPIKRKREIPVSQSLPAEPHLHDVVVEVGDLRPTLAHLGAEEFGMAAAGESGIAVIVDHDPILAPQSDDRDRRAQDQCDCALEADGPGFNWTKRRRSPVETGYDLCGFPTPGQKRVARWVRYLQTASPTVLNWSGRTGNATR